MSKPLPCTIESAMYTAAQSLTRIPLALPVTVHPSTQVSYSESTPQPVNEPPSCCLFRVRMQLRTVEWIETTPFEPLAFAPLIVKPSIVQAEFVYRSTIAKVSVGANGSIHVTAGPAWDRTVRS